MCPNHAPCPNHAQTMPQPYPNLASTVPREFQYCAPTMPQPCFSNGRSPSYPIMYCFPRSVFFMVINGFIADETIMLIQIIRIFDSFRVYYYLSVLSRLSAIWDLRRFQSWSYLNDHEPEPWGAIKIDGWFIIMEYVECGWGYHLVNCAVAK